MFSSLEGISKVWTNFVAEHILHDEFYSFNVFSLRSWNRPGLSWRTLFSVNYYSNQDRFGPFRRPSEKHRKRFFLVWKGCPKSGNISSRKTFSTMSFIVLMFFAEALESARPILESIVFSKLLFESG